MDVAAGTEEVLASPNNLDADVLWSALGFCAKFSAGAVYLYNLLIKRTFLEH